MSNNKKPKKTLKDLEMPKLPNMYHPDSNDIMSPAYVSVDPYTGHRWSGD